MDGAWHIAPLCQILVCGVHVHDGTETHEDELKESAYTGPGQRPKKSVRWGWTVLRIQDTDVVVHTISLHRFGTSASRGWEEPTCNCSKSHKKHSWGCGQHVHPCCCQRVQKLQKPQLVISNETKMHSFAQVTIDTCIAQHLGRLVGAAHTVGAVAVVVQRPK